MVSNLILDQIGIELTEVTIGRMLCVMGLTPQRPQPLAYQQNPARFANYLEAESTTINTKGQMQFMTIKEN